MQSRGQFPILEQMKWVMGWTILVVTGILLRRLLHMGAAARSSSTGIGSLRPDLQAVYGPLALEIEAHTTILGITLNDAFGERRAARHEMAWHVVRLAVGEWVRLAGLVLGVQSILMKFLGSTNGVVPLRRVSSSHFKSREAIDHVRFYEFLDQVLFSSRRRFSVQLRLLTGATSLLSKEFRRVCREGERSLDASDELWSRLDYYFHDFDLISKETLLALRTVLTCQSHAGVQELALDLQALLERGVRVSVSPSNQ